MTVTIEDFKEFVSKLRLNKKKTELKKFPWQVDVKHPFNDFCKEIVEPGLNKFFPRGAIGIRGDSDFFGLAALPYRFKDLTTQEIVSVLWPDKVDPMFLPDTDDEYWESSWDQDKEVKGFPVEIWLHAPSQSLRVDTARSYADAAKGLYFSTSSETEYEIMEWKDGERHSIVKGPIHEMKAKLLELAER